MTTYKCTRVQRRAYGSLKPMMKIRCGVVLVAGVQKDSFDNVAEDHLWRRGQSG